VPIAVTDVLIVAGGAGLIVVACGWWRRRKQQGVWRSALRLSAGAVMLAAAAYLVFLGLWGLNYRREPLARRLDFDGTRVTPEAVGTLGRRVVGRLNALHASAHATPWPRWER